MYNTKLRFEEFTTVLAQIESILNSRPLTPLSDYSEDCQALTPGHFLIGRPLNSIPEPKIEEPMTITRRYRFTQKLVEEY